MTTAQVVKTSVTVNNNSPIQDYVHLDDQTQTYFWNDSWVQTFHSYTSSYLEQAHPASFAFFLPLPLPQTFQE